jgi:hypothetical protein
MVAVCSPKYIQVHTALQPRRHVHDCGNLKSQLLKKKLRITWICELQFAVVPRSTAHSTRVCTARGPFAGPIPTRSVSSYVHPTEARPPCIPCYKFVHAPCWEYWLQQIKKCDCGVKSNCMTIEQNFIQIRRAVLGLNHSDGRTHRHDQPYMRSFRKKIIIIIIIIIS